MTRPSSYDDRLPFNRCGTCRHCHYVRYKQDLLCFHGDEIQATRDGPDTWDVSDVEFNGRDVQMLDGGDYDRVWGGRAVENGDTCDEWQAREGVGLVEDGSARMKVRLTPGSLEAGIAEVFTSPPPLDHESIQRASDALTQAEKWALQVEDRMDAKQLAEVKCDINHVLVADLEHASDRSLAIWHQAAIRLARQFNARLAADEAKDRRIAELEALLVKEGPLNAERWTLDEMLAELEKWKLVASGRTCVSFENLCFGASSLWHQTHRENFRTVDRKPEALSRWILKYEKCVMQDFPAQVLEVLERLRSRIAELEQADEADRDLLAEDHESPPAAEEPPALDPGDAIVPPDINQATIDVRESQDFTGPPVVREGGCES